MRDIIFHIIFRVIPCFRRAVLACDHTIEYSMDHTVFQLLFSYQL